MKTIGQQIKWDFKANGNLVIKEKNGNQIYWEYADGYWSKREYDSEGNIIYFEDSNRFWKKWEYDSEGNVIYFEDSNRFWTKREWNSQGKEIYFEDSYGTIIDNRPKTCEGEEIVIEGVKYKLTKV